MLKLFTLVLPIFNWLGNEGRWELVGERGAKGVGLYFMHDVNFPF